MKIEIKIEKDCTEPKVIVVTDKVTEEVNDIIKKLSEKPSEMFAGFSGDKATVLEPDSIYRIYASGGKVYAETQSETFVLRMRLYEAEERLAGRSFVRISNGEMVNLKKIKGLDLSFTGTVCISLTNKTVTYVSRRYVSKIKQTLSIYKNKKFPFESFFLRGFFCAVFKSVR